MEARPTLKLYHVHGMDSRDFLNHYFDTGSGFKDETVRFIMEKLHSALEIGHIKGDTLIDISIGSIVHQLFVVCEFFKEITILKLSESCIMELNKWVNTRTGAFDWTHACKIVTELRSTSAVEQDKEEKLKETIKRIVKFDFSTENLTDPEVLPPADCLITAWLLDVVSQDQQEYIRNLRKMLKLLKTGGYFIVIGCIDATYYTVGNDRLHALNYEESFVRKTLIDEGFEIVSCELIDGKLDSHLTDYKHLIVLTAIKG